MDRTKQMPKLLKLEMTNYCQHRHRVVDFSKSTTVITGNNGAGKSNIGHACKFALTGEITNNGNRKDDITWGEKKGSVALWFSIDVRVFKISRSLHNSDTSLVDVTAEPNKLLASTAQAVDSILEQLLGIPLANINRAFIKQGEIAAALYDTPAKRSAMFNKLFNTDTTLLREYLQSEIVASTTVSGNAGIIDELQARLDGDIIPNIDSMSTTLTKLQKSFDAINSKEANSIISTYTNYHNTLRSNTEKAEKAKKLKDEIAALNKEIVIVSKSLPDDPSAQLEALDQKSDEAAELIPRIEAYLTAASYYQAAQSSIAKNNAELCAIDKSIGKKLEKLKLNLDKLNNDLANTSMSLSEVSKLVEVIELGKCPTCLHDFTSEVEKLKQAKLEQAKLTKEINTLRKNKATLSTEVTDLTATFNSNNERIAVLTSENTKSALIEKPIGKKYTEDQLNIIKGDAQNIQDAINHLNVQIESMLTLKDKLAHKTELLNSITITDVKGIGIKKTQYDKAVKLLSDREELLGRINALKGALSTAIDNKEYTLNRIETIKEAELKYTKLNQYRNFCEVTRDMLHTSNMPTLINRKYIEILNTLISKYMCLFSAGFTCHITEDFEFKAFFPKDDCARSAARLSGGQKSILAISFWFAISELFTGGIGFILFDEPSAGLDKHAIEGLRYVFATVSQSMLSTGTQLIVITHEESLQTSFDAWLDVK